jgi:arylsulfatase A
MRIGYPRYRKVIMKNRVKIMIATIASFVVCGIAGAAQPQVGGASRSPNIIVILNDDQGYQDLGCFGSPDIKTPHIDRIATEGMKFTSFMVASPVCSASRAALLTGCYPNRVGVPSVFWPNRKNQGLNPKHVTIAEMLKTVGYKTKAVGKWHLGDELECLPTNQGFDSYYGIPYSNDMYPAKSMKYADDCLFREKQSFQTLEKAFAGKLNRGNPRSMKDKVPLMRNEECIEFPADQTTITKRYADEGIAFISESVKEDKPFFLYLANSMPHTPLFASPEFKGKSERGLYGDVIEEIDHNVGRILNHLKDLKIEENTIVVVTSDNGPWLIKGDDGGSALPLFEGKMTTFEGGQRVPCVMKWPGHIPAGSVCSEMALSMDLLPTFARITGAALPTVQPLDGKNIIALLTAKAGAETPHEFFFYDQTAVRHGDWKYHSKEIFKVKATARKSKGPTLYNLKEDIGESNNLIDQHPEIAERLAKVLESNPNKRGVKPGPKNK